MPAPPLAEPARCNAIATASSAGSYRTVSLRFSHPPSLSNRCCRAALLSAIASEQADRIVLVHGGSKRIYGGVAARALSGLASTLKALSPALCPSCAAELGNMWEDPLSYYCRARSRSCASCDAELKRIARMLRKSEFINAAISEGKPHLAWNLPATTTPSFFAADVLEKPPDANKPVERYAVGDVEVSIYRHPTRPDMLMVLDYPELGLSDAELQALVVAYGAVSKSRPAADDISSAFVARCAAAIDESVKDAPLDKQKLLAMLLRHTVGFGAIEPLLKDAQLQDIYVDSRSPLVHVVHSRWGECVTNLHMTAAELDKLATRIRMVSGRPLDASSPVLHAELENLGVRVAGICPPSTYDGTGFAFRRRKSSPWTLPEFVQAGMLDAKTAGLLSFLVDGQCTMLITGARASGKTSLLSALLLEVPQSTRIIVIEDTPEIPVETLHKHGFKIEHLKTEAWAKGFELSAEDALRTSLRLGESTLVLGEVRGPEARALFEAMRIGAAGNVVLGTIHGSSAYDTWDRVVNDLGVPSSSFKAVDV
ncbi:MAG: type II/IV secretion system ATPase subunit, partial [Candidatus Aenigmatarchaeota archaeon]